MNEFLIFLGVLIGFFVFIFLVFWCINFCENRERERRDARDRKKWDTARRTKFH